VSSAQVIYDETFKRLVDQLEAGTNPWRKMWTGGSGLQLRSCGTPYKGGNQFILMIVGMTRGFASSHWMTYKQALGLGGQVRKGERSTHIQFFKTGVKEKPGEDPTTFRMARTYSVFNADQIDGLPPQFLPVSVAVNPDARDASVEAALGRHRPTVRHVGGTPCYIPSLDVIHLPQFEAFETAGSYYATLAHELVHWTKTKARCDRSTDSYAFEELVAEIGACFVTARLGIQGEHIDNHAAYLAAWAKRIREDKQAIFKAATLAQIAADFLLEGEANADRIESGSELELEAIAA
jgi:antirestriction protein ArdC